MAIGHAQKVQYWFKNLSMDEIPPRYIWMFDELLTEWFERVREKRNAGRTGQPAADTEGSGWETNDLAKGLRD